MAQRLGCWLWDHASLAGGKGDHTLAGNHLPTGSAAIGTTHITACGLFQFDFAMLTEWRVVFLGPL